MPVPMHSHNDIEDGELVRQTSAMNITEESWLESTEKVFKLFDTAFKLANNVSSTRSKTSRKFASAIVAFFTVAREAGSMARIESSLISRR